MSATMNATRSPAMMPNIAQAQQVTRIHPRERQVAPEASMPTIGIGFGNLQAFEFTQRVAKAFASSNLVPMQYRMMNPMAKFGPNKDKLVENQNAIPNCMIALNMADRIGADPLMVMQNLYIVEGRPSWSAQFVISAINSCGRFNALKFRINKGKERTMEYSVTEWDDSAGSGRGAKVNVKKTATFIDMSCTAYTTEKATGEEVVSSEVSMELAVKEGWYGRNGSKWQTMPEQMLMYRSAAFFGRIHAPEVLMGLRTVEENVEIIEAEKAEDGSWHVPEAQPMRDHGPMEEAKAEATQAEQQPAEAVQQAAQGQQQPAHDPVTGEVPQAGDTSPGGEDTWPEVIDRETGKPRPATQAEAEELRRLAADPAQQEMDRRAAEAANPPKQRRSNGRSSNPGLPLGEDQ